MSDLSLAHANRGGGKPRRGIARWPLVGYLAINVPLVVGLFVAPEALRAVLQLLIASLAVAALVTGVVWQRPAVPAAWWLIVAGAAASAGAASTRAAALTAGGTGVFGGSVGQWLFAASFVLFIAGLGLLVRLSGRAYLVDTLDAMVVALATFLLLYWLVIGSLDPAGGTSVLAEIVYPFGALLLLATTVRLAFSVRLPTVSLGLLLLAMCARVASTVSLEIPVLTTGSLQASGLTPYLSATFGLLLGSAALHPSLAATRARSDRGRELVSPPRVLLLVLMALVGLTALATEVLRVGRTDAQDLTVLITGGSVLVVLIVARLGLTARMANRWATELARRSDDLTEAVREQEALQRQLRHQAMHDPLTGLPNRVVLTERLDWALTRRERRPAALAVVEFDRFEDVNDTHGHVVGDAILVEVARRLLALTPGHGMLARLVGDKFAVLVDDTGVDEAKQWAEQVRSGLRLPYRIGEQDLFMEPRIGLRPIGTPRPTPTAAQALRDADLALRAARDDRRGQVAVFSPELLSAQAYVNRLSNGLRHALARDELTLDYQPIIEMGTRRVIAAEALLRWNPPGAPATPSEFIPVAEQTGMIQPIGAWVLRTACRDAQSWYRRYGLAVTVNVSARQLDDPGFAELVDQLLRQYQLPGSALVLEITENSLVATATAREANSQLELLRSRGVRVAIDDFGTGYSSLSYLTRLPVDLVKIDRSFVQELDPGHGSRRWAFTRAILHLVEAMGLHAVAEGVETREQEVALRNLRCPLAQGFLFGRPMPARDLERILADSAGEAPEAPDAPRARILPAAQRGPFGRRAA